MGEHTPTPWVADRDWREGLSWNIHIVDAANPDMRICFMTSDGPAKANAAFIVKACNSHDALVKALEEARGALASLDNMSGSDSGLSVIRGGKSVGSIIDEALAKVSRS